jgi:phosphoribosylglycinamide formyltransferase-1
MHILFLVSGYGEHIVLKNFHSNIAQKEFTISVAGFQEDSTGIVYARKNKIDYYIFSYSTDAVVFSNNLTDIVTKVDPDAIFLLFDKILPLSFINRFSKPIINIHPSLLPSFKGLMVVDKAINYGSKITGVSIHFVNEILDGGPIIMQSVIPISDKISKYSNLQDVYRRHFVLMSTQVLFWLQSGRLNIEDRKVCVDKARYDLSEFYPNVESDVIDICKNVIL